MTTSKMRWHLRWYQAAIKIIKVSTKIKVQGPALRDSWRLMRAGLRAPNVNISSALLVNINKRDEVNTICSTSELTDQCPWAPEKHNT